MKNPYITFKGHIYEKELIEVWFEDNNTDPITNEVLENTNIMLNIFAKKQIYEWREKHKN